jgi:hypothetical protein
LKAFSFFSLPWLASFSFISSIGFKFLLKTVRKFEQEGDKKSGRKHTGIKINIYGYKFNDDKILKKDEYQSKVVKLIYDLGVYGLNEREIKNLLNEFKVPKNYEKEIDFNNLKQQMIQRAEKWRQEEKENSKEK